MSLPSQDIRWAEFAPDASPYSSQFSDSINNVEPRIDGYGPLPKLGTFGTALPARCLGAFNFRKADGSSAIFAGTATKLYRYNVGTSSWDEVTRSSGGNYATPDGSYWNFAQFGARLVAVNGTDVTQYIDVDGGGTNFAALPNAPIAKYVATIGDFLMFGHLSTDINAIAWSGINNSEYYTFGFRGSDTQSFPDGGFVQGIVSYGNGAIVFQRDKIRQLNRVGGNLVFTVSVLQDEIGCFAPQSITSTGQTFFWYDQSGFYEGPGANRIGAERINKYINQIATGTLIKRIRGDFDPVRQMVWFIVDTGVGVTRMIGYDYNLNKWTQSDDQVDFIFPSITPGYTIDNISSLFATIDEITIPFDSSFWLGTGVLAMAGFTYAGAFGYLTGFNQEATLETNDFEINPGDYGYLQSARVITDATYDEYTVAAGSRPFHGQAMSFGGAVQPSAMTGRAFLRKRGKTHRLRVTFEEDAAWNSANGVTVYARGAGSR